MKRSWAWLVLCAFLGSGLAHAEVSSAIDAEHERVMQASMAGHEALQEAESLARTDPPAACLAYKRAVTSLGQSTTGIKHLSARLKPDDTAQSALIAHLQDMQGEDEAALATARSGVSANCR